MTKYKKLIKLIKNNLKTLKYNLFYKTSARCRGLIHQSSKPKKQPYYRLFFD